MVKDKEFKPGFLSLRFKTASINFAKNISTKKNE